MAHYSCNVLFLICHSSNSSIADECWIRCQKVGKKVFKKDFSFSSKSTFLFLMLKVFLSPVREILHNMNKDYWNSQCLSINLYDEGDIWTIQGILRVNSLQSSNSWLMHKEIVTAGDELREASWNTVLFSHKLNLTFSHTCNCDLFCSKVEVIRGGNET